MTFYNLPGTNVKVEYNKDDKRLKILNLPKDPDTDIIDVIRASNVENNTEEVWVDWGIVTNQTGQKVPPS